MAARGEGHEERLLEAMAAWQPQRDPAQGPRPREVKVGWAAVLALVVHV